MSRSTLLASLALALLSLTCYGREMPGLSAASLSSIGEGEEQSPPVYRPKSSSFISSQMSESMSPHKYWLEKTSLTLEPNMRNCLLCENQDSEACRSMPSCVYCETTATALCEISVPCSRCTVIKNPFFRCIPGEKYMDECDSCRCTDGYSGWCTNQFCEYRVLHLYAMALSGGEYY